MKNFSIRIYPFFWLKKIVIVDLKFVNIVNPNTILGFIPVGIYKKSISVQTIQSTIISGSYNLKQMITSLFFLFVGIIMMSDQFIWGNICLGIGIFILSNSIQTNLLIKNSGADVSISVPFFKEYQLFDIQKQIYLSMTMHS